MDDYISQKEVDEIVSMLDGADEQRDLEVCEKLGVDQSFTWDLMESQGLQRDGDRWAKRKCPTFKSA